MHEPVVIPAENRLPNGRVVVWSVTTGGRYERGEDQAQTLLATGQFRLTKDAVPEAPAPERTADRPKGPHGAAPAASVPPRRRRAK